MKLVFVCFIFILSCGKKEVTPRAIEGKVIPDVPSEPDENKIVPTKPVVIDSQASSTPDVGSDTLNLSPLEVNFIANTTIPSWNTLSSEFISISAPTESTRILVLKNGSALEYNILTKEIKPLFSIVQVPEAQTNFFTVSQNVTWHIAEKEIKRYQKENGQLKSAVIGDLELIEIRVLHARDDALILDLKKEAKLLIVNDGELTEYTVPYPDDVIQNNKKVVGSFLSNQKDLLVFLTLDAIYGYQIVEDFKSFVQGTRREITLKSSLENLNLIAFEANKDLEIADVSLALTDSSIFALTSEKTAAVEVKIPWTDVRQFVESSCKNCHGSSGAGNFSHVDREESWQGQMGVRAYCRMKDTNAPMPPNASVEKANMKAPDKEKTLKWFEENRGKVDCNPL